MKKKTLSIIVYVGVILAVTAGAAYAVSTSARYAGTASDSGTNWTNPSNATGDTTSTAATLALTGNGTISSDLRLTNFGFTSSDVPVGATINGVTVEVEWQAGATNIVDNTIQLTTDGTNGTGDNKALGTTQTTKGIRSYGGSADGWNASLTQATVTSSNFGVILNYRKTSGGGATTTSVFRVRMTIEYSVPTITVSGTSNLSSGTVAIAVNGNLQGQTGSITGGSWTISGVNPPSAGAVVTVFVNGATDANESTGVTLYDGSGNITGMVLDQNVLSVGSSDNQSLTATNLGQYDSDQDEDILHTANAGTLNATAGGTYTDPTIRILSSNTLTIGSAETLSAHNVRIDGTLTSTTTASYTVSGSWDNNSVFNRGTSSITFTSTSTETIDSTGSTTSSLYDVIFNGSGGQWTVPNTPALTVNDITTQAGTLTGNPTNLTVQGGDIVCGVTCGTINMTGGTVTVQGDGNFGTAGLSSNWNFTILVFATPSTTTTAQGDGTINVDMTLKIDTSHTLDAGSKTWNLVTGGGLEDLFVNSGTFIPSTSTINYEVPGTVFMLGTTYYNLGIGVSSDGMSSTNVPDGDITVLNTLTVGSPNAGERDSLFSDIPVTITLLGSGNPLVVNAGGEITPHGLITFQYHGTSATNILGITYYNLEVGTDTDLNSVTFTLQDDIEVRNVLTIGGTSGSTDTLDVSSHTIILSGSGTPLVVNAGGSFNASTSTVHYQGTSATNVAPTTYYNLGIGTDTNGSTTTFTLQGDITVLNVLTVGGGSGSTDTLDASTRAITLSGSGTPFVINTGGAFTASTSTVSYQGTSATNIATVSYNNLGVGTNANSTATTYTLSGNIGVSGVLTVGNASSTAVDTLDGSSRTLTLSGSGTPFAITAWGNFTESTSTVNYQGTSATGITADTYYNLGIGTDTDANAVTFTAQGNTTISNILTIGGGSGSTDTFDASSHIITLSGSGTPLSIQTGGSFSSGTSTVSYQNTSSATVARVTYYNLEFAPVSGTPTYTLNGGGTLTTNNDFTIGGAGNATVNAETSDPTVTVGNNFTIGSSDTYSASSTNPLTISGNFTNNGTFTANTGTVVFSDSGKTSQLNYSANTSFYGLSVTTASKALQFDETQRTTISNSFTINGQACGTKIQLRSMVDSNQFDLDTTGATESIQYADIKDSNALDSITATNSLDSGNNSVDWTINSCPPSVTTNAASDITPSQAVLNATINPNGGTTDAYFVYGTSDVDCDTLPGSTVLTDIGSGQSNTTHDDTVSNLSPNTTYYFCAVAENSGGTVYGTKLSFVTDEAAGPSKVVFTNSANTFTAGVCSGATDSFAIQLQDPDNNPANPSGSTTIQITSDSTGTFSVWSADDCVSGQHSSGNITFSTSENTKTFYIIDTKKGSHTLTATKTIGPDTISPDTDSYTVQAGDVTRLVVTLLGQSFTDGSGNSGTVTGQTAGEEFTITSISATDNYFNVNTDYSGPKTLSYTGPSDALDETAPSYTTSVSFTNGQSTTTLSTTLYKAETTAITVTEGGEYGHTSSNITVTAGDISTDAEDSLVEGEAIDQRRAAVALTITLRDAYHNPKSGVLGSSISFAGTTATFTQVGNTSTSNASGVSTARLKWSDIGTKTVTVSISGVGTLSDTHLVEVITKTPKVDVRGGFNFQGGISL